MSPEVAVAAAVQAAVAPVLGAVPFYDYVPASGQLDTPLVALGGVATQRIVDRCANRWQIAFRLHLFSKGAADGRVWVWNTLHAMRTALHLQPLSLADPYRLEERPREVRSSDMADRLQAFDQAFIDFTLTVSSPA
jgi:hypothetical protein